MKKIITRKKCDDSGCDGEARNTGNGYTITWGTTWLHKCNKCGKEVPTEYNESYPSERIEYEPHEIEEEWV